MNLQTARKYEDLLTGTIDPSPFDYAMMFKADGFFARQRAKTRFKLLKAIERKLLGILRPQERVYWVTTGTTVTLGEQFFVGWIAYYLNRRALVFSTERVLLLEVSRGDKPGHLVSQIPYTAIASVKSTWNGLCRVKLLNKKAYAFQSVPSADRKFLADFLRDITQGTNAPFQRIQGMENMCPHCYTVVAGHPAGCPSCGGGFKSARQAALMSFVFPGTGDWYIGHRGIAVLEMLGTCFWWLVLVIAPLLLPPDPEVPPLTGEYWLTVAAVLLVGHGIDAIVTYNFARKGHYPKGARLTAAAGLPPRLAGA
jgi:hypothetical protein